MPKEFTDEARYKAGKSQMNIFLSYQFLEWRMIAVKSICKILQMDERFYSDMFSDSFNPDQRESAVRSIRNGWFFEAVSQSEQAIEDLFSLLKNANDIAFFARDVINYKAVAVKDYIWNFNIDDLQYILNQFHLPYFNIDESEEWEHKDVFKAYKNAVLLMQEYLKELIEFHKKYYLDYCQYKHGMSVGLKPAEASIQNEFTREKSNENALLTFDNFTIDKRLHKGIIPALAFMLTPDVQPFVKRLYEEQNLLHYSLHHVNMDEVVTITEKAYQLLSVVWNNLIERSGITDEATIQEWCFPTEKIGSIIRIGFPVDNG